MKGINEQVQVLTYFLRKFLYLGAFFSPTFHKIRLFPSRGTPATLSHTHIEGKFRFSVNLTHMFLVCGRKLERAEETQAGMESTRTTEEKFPTAATK